MRIVFSFSVVICYAVLQTELCLLLPSNSHVKALTSSVTVFGDKNNKEVIKVKWSHKVTDPIESSLTLSIHTHQGKTM